MLGYGEDGKVGAYSVVATMTARRPLIELQLADGRVVVGTAEHPFFTGVPGVDGPDEAGAWTDLGDLAPGATVLSLSNGALVPSEVARVTPLPERGTVHNLTVEGAKTFFAEGILVHNKTQCSQHSTLGIIPNAPP